MCDFDQTNIFSIVFLDIGDKVENGWVIIWQLVVKIHNHLSIQRVLTTSKIWTVFGLLHFQRL